MTESNNKHSEQKTFTYNGKFNLCKLCSFGACDVPCEIVETGKHKRAAGEFDMESLKKKELEKAARKEQRYIARLELGLVDVSGKVILTEVEKNFLCVQPTADPLVDIVKLDFGRGEAEYYRFYEKRSDGRYGVLEHKSV